VGRGGRGQKPSGTFDLESPGRSLYALAVGWFEPESERVGRRHVQIFLPSVDRDGLSIPEGQEYWVEECLKVLGSLFGGATAFPPARGVWRDDERGELRYDNTVIVFSYVAEDDLTGTAGRQLHGFLMRLGRETNQGEVGILVDGEYRGFRRFDEFSEHGTDDDDPEYREGENEDRRDGDG
jgi:hypothetical protein